MFGKPTLASEGGTRLPHSASRLGSAFLAAAMVLLGLHSVLAAQGQDLDARLDALIFREPARIPEMIGNGRPSLLVFTDHHCAACLSMVPTVERLLLIYEGRANIITIDPQDPNLAVRLLSGKYGVWGTPMLVLLDHTGAVRKKLYGPQREKTLAGELDRFLRAKR